MWEIQIFPSSVLHFYSMQRAHTGRLGSFSFGLLGSQLMFNFLAVALRLFWLQLQHVFQAHWFKRSSGTTVCNKILNSFHFLCPQWTSFIWYSGRNQPMETYIFLINVLLLPRQSLWDWGWFDSTPLLLALRLMWKPQTPPQTRLKIADGWHMDSLWGGLCLPPFMQGFCGPNSLFWGSQQHAKCSCCTLCGQWPVIPKSL